MSNELNNIIARNSDGVYEGVAIGGDRYPGTRFIDHLLRYQDNPAVSVSACCFLSKGAMGLSCDMLKIRLKCGQVHNLLRCVSLWSRCCLPLLR